MHACTAKHRIEGKERRQERDALRDDLAPNFRPRAFGLPSRILPVGHLPSEGPAAMRRRQRFEAEQPLDVHLPDRPRPPVPMTYDAFLAWADEDTLAEWVEGTIELSSPASFRHQRLATFLVTLFTMYVGTRRLGTVIAPPF